MIIIGIAGGTGSGKTTVVKSIIDSLPADEVALLPLDSYYKDSSHVPVEERQNINFDHPNAFDWDLLSEQVEMLKQGKAIEYRGEVLGYEENLVGTAVVEDYIGTDAATLRYNGVDFSLPAVVKLK